ncbi:CCHC-type domain-containing protein [Trichonephila clavipes]|nr:CCHC-type domain-containing protein [Trichonephila clavipes]
MAKTFLDSTLTVTPHKSLNCSRDVISKSDLLCTSEAEILEGLSDQGVIQVRRITILRDSKRLPTKHIILTFNSPKLPTSIKARYLNCKIRPYVPNPLRCFKCQRSGHSQTAFRGQLTCSRCATVGHPSTDFAAVNKSSTSTQAELVPSTSSVTVTLPSKSQPTNSLIDTVSTASDNLSISTASSSSTACSVLETTTTTSNTIPTTSQDTTQTSKPCRKKRPPKNQSNTIKPKIEIKTAPHRPRKSAPTEYSTDEENERTVLTRTSGSVLL